MLRPLLAILLLALAAPALAKPAKSDPVADEALAPGRSDLTPQERYEFGMRLMKRGYFTRALEELNRVRNYHRDDPASVKAELAIAELYYRKGDYEQARLAFEDFARLHPRHEDLDYVVFMTGKSIFRRAPKYAGRDQGATQQAVHTWTGFATRFPDSEHVAEVDDSLAKARERLASKEWFVATFYSKRDAWQSVQMRTATLLKKYPDSARVPDAMALRGEALHAWGEVGEAEALLAALQRDYPDTAAAGHLARVLSRPAGTPPEEAIFVRPYRVSSGVASMPGAGY